jgi:hypothetical protein
MLKFYEALLDAAGLVVTADGCVSIKTSKDAKPLTMKGKRLVLPTREHLSAPSPDTKVIFHPLVENVMRGESEVFERFRMAINGRMNVVFGTIVHTLLQLGTSEADQKKLSPEQTEFLSKVKNADEKTLLAYKKVMDSLSATQHQKLFVSMFIKRGGTVADKRYARVGVVHFPLYNELKKGESELHGVKLRVKDREALIGLLDYILPEQDIAGVYNRGSNSTVAPSLEALLLSVQSIAAPLNDLIDRFAGILPENLLINSDWVEQLVSLDELLNEIRSTPMQAGNEGTVPGTEAAATQASTQAQTAFNTPIGQSQQGTPGVTLAAHRPAPPPATPGWPAPQTHAPVPASSSAPARTPSGGTDFEALVRSNQGLQQAVGWGSAHGWNPGQSFQPAVPQRASLSNPVGPVGGGGQWGGQQQQWGSQGGSWGNQGGGAWGGQQQVRL